jgi:alpha-ketoglutarate-dependent taurine dioxygenase
MATVEIEPIKPLIGGIVHVKRADLLDKAVVERCRQALEERGVLVFPRMGLSDEEQLAFTDSLGARVNYTRSVPGGSAAAPDVYKITLDPRINQQPEYVEGTFFWHVDGVTIDQPLPKATLLTARSVAQKGGHTEFSNLYAAYEALPDEEKEEIAGLKVVHTMESSMRPVYDKPTEEDYERWRRMAKVMEHPLVWTHASGRKSLLLGTHADRIVGMPLPHGRALLTRLMQWASRPEFCYRHRWQEGDLVMWDNCGTMHRVVPYAADSGRTMHRTTIMGSERVGRPLESVA